MNEVVQQQLMALQYGEPREFGEIALVPLFLPGHDGPAYLSMQQAMESQSLVVTELDSGASVPELKVHNRSAMPVLLLDGEELAGAKQNRVLNTTVLLKEAQVTVIPVSCTEQGRWSYVSDSFRDSGVVMAASIRGAHKESVNASLRQSGRYASDQGEVWNRIEDLSRSAGVSAPTGAMRDVFERRTADIMEYLEALPCIPEQQGMVVFVNGRVVGCDFLSQPSAYVTLHPKLIKSYTMDALTSERQQPSRKTNYSAAARKLVESATPAAEKRYESVGHGVDYRYEGNGVVGSALVYQDHIIHAAFFAASGRDTSGRMASARMRMRYRVY